MVVKLWVPESIQTFSQAVSLLQPASHTPGAEIPGETAVTKGPPVSADFAVAQLVSPASCESPFTTERIP